MKDKIKEKTYPPYKCRVCGIGEIKESHEICNICGWEDDAVQNDDPNYTGGANELSLNQYRQFWLLYKDQILKHIDDDPFIAIKKSQEYEKLIKK